MKAWGNKNDKPIFVTHGRLDNAGSFDRLIPLLPQTYYYICIDLPSHGKSSPLPPFFPIHLMDFVLVYKVVLEYFNKEKYIILAHSFGALIAHYFTRLYPQFVEKLIGIDSISACMPVYMFKDYLTNSFDSMIRIHEKYNCGNRRTYTEEEAIEKVGKGRWGGSITPEAAKPLAKRMMEPVGKLLYQGLYTNSLHQDTVSVIPS